MNRESLIQAWMRVASASLVLVCFFAGMPAAAMVETRLDDATIGRLQHLSPVQTRFRIEKLPLADGVPADIDLKEFEVWSPGGRIMVQQADGSYHAVVPEAVRYFGGSVVGRPDSTAMFSIGGKAGPSGLIIIGGKRFEVRRMRSPRTGERTDDYAIVEFEPSDDWSAAQEEEGWTCGNESLPEPPIVYGVRQPIASDRAPVSQALSGTKQYVMTLQIETDPQFYTAFGSQSGVTTYVTNLIAAMSTIYQRDINTRVQIANIVLHPTTDVWNQGTSTNSLLNQLTTTYVTTPALQSIQRNTVVLLSGKSLGGGVAWRGVAGMKDCSVATCGGDFGAYAVCTSYGTDGANTPDPNATQNGVVYGMPVAYGNSNYWGLAQITHEVGHSLGATHTHCMVLTAAEEAALGRHYVDVCYSGQNGCYSGTESVPPQIGTIMSYCHLYFKTGYPQSRYTLGNLADYTHHVLDDPATNGGTGLNVFLSRYWPSMSALTAPVSVAANSVANTATVVVASNGTSPILEITQTSAGVTWQITGGTITGGQGTGTVTFTAGASGSVLLRATAMNTRGAGVTDTKTVVISGGCVGPVIGTQPAGTTITAGASATLTVAATGATSYQWYTGASGVTTSPVAGGTGASITVSPETTTTYWVRVTNACGSVNSSTALVNTGTGLSGDANSDGSVGVDDIFYLINFLFSGGPASIGLADTNANGSVGVDDVFYLINYLFSGGPAPQISTPALTSTLAIGDTPATFSLGRAEKSADGWRLPVYVNRGGAALRAFSLSVRGRGTEHMQIHAAGVAQGLDTLFEAAPRGASSASYVVAFRGPVWLSAPDRSIVAELTLAGEKPDLVLDPTLSVVDFGGSGRERQAPGAGDMRPR